MELSLYALPAMIFVLDNATASFKRFTDYLMEKYHLRLNIGRYSDIFRHGETPLRNRAILRSLLCHKLLVTIDKYK